MATEATSRTQATYHIGAGRGLIRNLMRLAPVIFLLISGWTTSSVANESHNLASSIVPGELWRIHFNPTPDHMIWDATVRHSTDYGYTWTVVNDSGANPFFHRTNGYLTVFIYDIENDIPSLLLTPDNFATDTIWTPVYSALFEWLPDTSAWIAYDSQRGYSYDSLRTWQWPRWLGNEDENHNFEHIEQYTCLGWSPGDMISFGSYYGHTACYFSTTYADTFFVRGTLSLNGGGIYNITPVRGYAPGEVYLMDFSDRERVNVSLDTMMTWEGWRPLPDMQNYIGCSYETERGWSPGEIFIMLYEPWNPEVPRIGIWRTADFGNTWTMVYSTIDDVSVAEHPIELPSEEIRIWPNPGNGSFRVTIPITTVLMKVFDSLGREVLSIHPAENSIITPIDLSEHASGMYFLQVIDTKKGMTTKKIIYLP